MSSILHGNYSVLEEFCFSGRFEVSNYVLTKLHLIKIVLIV